jgi:hypothetical protein
MKHADLRLDTVYSSGGTPVVLVSLDKFVRSWDSKAITPAPAGDRYFGVLAVRLPAFGEYTAARLSELRAEAERLREYMPTTTVARGAEGFSVLVENLGSIDAEWGAYLADKATKSQREDAEAERLARARAWAKDAFPAGAGKPPLEDRLQEMGRMYGNVELEIFVPDSSDLLVERELWNGKVTLDVLYKIGLSQHLRDESAATLLRGFGEAATISYLTTSRDLFAAVRLEDGYSVPVTARYEVYSPAAYNRLLEGVPTPSKEFYPADEPTAVGGNR